MFTITEFLHQEVKPALGCTEPGAVALAVAKACEQLDGLAEKLEVVVSDNIFKNGIAVGVPGTGGERGNEIAAALAVFCGHSAYSLEVLKDATPEDLDNAKDFIAEGKLTLTANGKGGVYVEATAYRGSDVGTAVIEHTHANITVVKKNGEVVYQAVPHCDGVVTPGAKAENAVSIPDEVKKLNFEELVALANTLSKDDIDYVWEGIEMNLRISRYGFDHHAGLGLGCTVRDAAGDSYKTDLAAQVKAISAGTATIEVISSSVLSISIPQNFAFS